MEKSTGPVSPTSADLTPASWDLVVIGGGTAGLVASQTASGFGARVLLVESDRMGGECLWTGCVPSKAFIVAANAARIARGSERLGVSAGSVAVDFARVMAHVHESIAAIEPADSADALRRHGVKVLSGRARFTGAQTLTVDGTTIGFRQAIIATGSSPVIPPIDGIDTLSALTNETFWQLNEAPSRLVVIGAGSIGCEIGQAMASLGSSVTLVERRKRVLPEEDEAASAVIRRALVSEGVDVRTGAEAIAVRSTDGVSGMLCLDDGSEVAFDRLLLALGRVPNTRGLGLESAEVKLDGKGNVVVDAQLRTSNPRIRAAGDVTGGPRFTHTAGVNGSIAATNAMLGLSRTTSKRVVPRVTFTSPEVGSVGVGTADAGARGRRTITSEHARLDRAIAEHDTTGFTRIVVDRKGRILGATVVGPRAGETLGELTLAIQQRLSTTDVAGTTHAYPTWNDAVWNSSVDDLRGRLRKGVLGRVTRVLRWLRARRLK